MAIIVGVILLAVGISVAEENHTNHDADFGEYGHFSTVRKSVCEKTSDELIKDFDKCIKMEKESVIDANNDCLKEVFPSAEGPVDTELFTKEACKDPSKFRKFDDCFDEFMANPAFKQQVHSSEEVKGCYKSVFDKYKIDGSEVLKTFTNGEANKNKE